MSMVRHVKQAKNNMVAVVLATYNGEQFLTEQLESIVNQSYKDWHIVASDDGSNDKTLELLAEFSTSHPGMMTVVSHKGHGGACENFLDALNDALSMTDASYLAFCDQDDFWERDKLEASMTVLQDLEGINREPSLVFCDAAVTDARLNVTAPSFFDFTGVNPSRTKLNHLLVQNPISGAAMLFNRSLAEIVAQSHYGSQIWMHDQWVGLIAACFGKIASVNMPLYKYRQHDDNAMGAIEMSWKLVTKKAQDARNSLNKKQSQAKYLLETYSDSLPQVQKTLLEQFSTISSLPKLSRIGCCLRNSFFMNGALRNAGLFLFI